MSVKESPRIKNRNERSIKRTLEALIDDRRENPFPLHGKDRVLEHELHRMNWQLDGDLHVANINESKADEFHKFFADRAREGKIAMVEDTASRIHLTRGERGKMTHQIRLTDDDLRGLGMMEKREFAYG